MCERSREMQRHTHHTFGDIGGDVCSREEHEGDGELGAESDILTLSPLKVEAGTSQQLEDLLVQASLLGHGEGDLAFTQGGGEGW